MVCDWMGYADAITDEIRGITASARRHAERRNGVTLGNERVEIVPDSKGKPCAWFTWDVIPSAD